MTFRSAQIRDMCRDEACVGCGAHDETVVPAHKNEGKGIGIKTSDATCIPLCRICHDVYDNGNASKADKRSMWEHWFSKWGPKVIERLAGQASRLRVAKPLSKIVQRRA